MMVDTDELHAYHINKITEKVHFLIYALQTF